MELEPKKSKLYSIDRKFTLCLKGLEKKSVGVGYFISGITKTPIFVQKSENEDEVILDIDLTHELSSYDYRWIKIETFQVVYGDDGQEFANGQNYGLYYGKCKLMLESTGKTNDRGDLLCSIKCSEDNVNLDYLGMKYSYSQIKDNYASYTGSIPIKWNQEEKKLDKAYSLYVDFKNQNYCSVFNKKIELKDDIILSKSN